MTADLARAAPPAIDYGERLRLGVIVPSGNVIAEPQIRAMLPPGIGFHVTRLALRGSSDAELLRMADGVEAAARLLGDACVDLIVFHCTAVTTFSPGIAESLRARIAETTGIAAVATADALLAAFAALRIRKVVLLTPYIADIHEREKRYLDANGIAVVGDARLDIETNTEMAQLPPEALYDLAVRNRAAEADAYFLSCTALRSAEIIAPLERALGKPVITSNQVMVWHVLRRQGVTDAVPGFGRLFEVA